MQASRMSRPMCYQCFWPRAICWCASIRPIQTRTKFLFLTHPKEFKQEKAGTGRLTHLCLANSEVHMGVGFDDHDEVQALLRDPRSFPVLLHPGREAVNLSDADLRSNDGSKFARLRAEIQQRALVVFLIDATWALGRKMLRLSPSLQQLPRIMFTPSAPSRYVIKQQPHAGCLSTLEATHELLTALEGAELDRYPLPGQLLALFQRMQEFQLRCAADPSRVGYRHRAFKPLAERVAFKGRSAARRAKLFQAPN